jgi:hypothetical protein
MTSSKSHGPVPGWTKPLPGVNATVPRLMSYSALRRESGFELFFVSDDAPLRSSLFRDLLRIALERVPFDEQYYLRLYPDVGEALEHGLFTSPRHHYVEFGYFEDRLPSRIEVDEEFYFQSNPDIKESVSSGFIPSAQIHFERYGYKEGRLPREGWSLLANQ